LPFAGSLLPASDPPLRRKATREIVAVRVVGNELLLAVSLLSLSAPAGAARPACAASDEEMIAAIRAVHDKQRNVGVQSAIRIDGRLVFSHAHGWADRENRIPVTPHTVFPVASITKAFTGVAALKAMAAGKLNLDAPIQRYVPEFPVKPELTVTPARLAAHRAGIRHWGPERQGLYSRHYNKLAEILPLFKDDPLLPKAGVDYQYSSYGYNLLGLAVERATGVDFTRYVQREILRPLRLTRTRFDDARKPPRNMVKVYSFFDLVTYAEFGGADAPLLPALDYSHNMAGGNMSTSAEDATRFGSALLGPGFLPPRPYRMLFEQPTFGGEASPMSYGFFAPEATGERRLTISGASHGHQAGLMIYPERKLVVAVLSNTWGQGSRSGDMVSALPKQLADLCAPVPPALAAGQ
jgi:CubicO group peptidase (beta-lactamase class C family)